MFEGEILENEQWLKQAACDGETGLFYDGTNFAECFEMSKEINPKTCWEKAHDYSLQKMMDSFASAVKDVMDA